MVCRQRSQPHTNRQLSSQRLVSPFRSEAVNLLAVGCDKRAEQGSWCAGAEI
jgi:hypothetical protein